MKSLINLKYFITLIVLLTIISCSENTNHNQKSTDETKLTVTLSSLDGGFEITDILDGDRELLNKSAALALFDLTLQTLSNRNENTISADRGWDNVAIQREGDRQTVTLSNPISDNFPKSLEVKITIKTTGTKSQWDLKVDGIGKGHSLISTNFPNLNIKATPTGSFLVPHGYGQEIQNPANGISQLLTYPRGFGATMQFLAYYDNNQGTYFGFHDPKAALKRFHVEDKNGGVELHCSIPAPNQSLPNNNWKMPGHFELDSFSGDWYDAALIYKEWASHKAEYWPKDTIQREARQKSIGNISIWLTETARDYTLNQLETHIRDFKNFMDFEGIDIPIAITWNSWYDMPMDLNFPEIFPPLNGLSDMMKNLKTSYGDSVRLTGYMNGRLYDTEHLDSYSHGGEAAATKQADGLTVYTQNFQGTIFALMCPTQSFWQDIMIDSAQQMATDIGFDGLYIDQVTAASPIACMDPLHHHTLAGGTYWRDGYKAMFHQIHQSLHSEKFVTSEGANDFLIDEVDGFLTEVFITNHQVPAFQVVYSDKVQFIGSATGASSYKADNTPDSQKFYGRLAQSFAFGVIPGRFFTGVAVHQNARSARAAQYLRRLARMRRKLVHFTSFGEMKRPLALSDTIPMMRFTAFGGTSMVETPAIQTSTWSDGESIMVLFVNGKVPQLEGERITFDFDFDTSLYGIDEAVSIQEITESLDGPYAEIENQFHKEVTLSSYEVKAFIITPRSKI